VCSCGVLLDPIFGIPRCFVTWINLNTSLSRSGWVRRIDLRTVYDRFSARTWQRNSPSGSCSRSKYLSKNFEGVQEKKIHLLVNRSWFGSSAQRQSAGSRSKLKLARNIRLLSFPNGYLNLPPWRRDAVRRDQRCGGFTKQQRRPVAQHHFNNATEADFRLLAPL
jgi:hypothetical protein